MPEPTPARTMPEPATETTGRPAAHLHHRAHTGGAARLRLVTAPPPDAPDPGTAHRPVPLPPPTPALQRLALYAFEAVEGARTVSQLAGTVTPDVARELQARRALRTERRTMLHDHRRIVAIPGPVHSSRPHPEAIEAAVVLHARGRTSVVAFRIEWNAERWRATELTVL